MAALLPYAVLRYYFGGVDVLNDLAIIAHMLMASMVLTAGAVALSAAPLAVRILVLIGVLPAMTMGLSGFAMMRVFGGFASGMIISSSLGGPGWWLLPCMTALYVYMLLEFAAAKFAPPSENHPARKRTAALLLSITCCPPRGSAEWSGSSRSWDSLRHWSAGWWWKRSRKGPSPCPRSMRRSRDAVSWHGGLGRFLYPGWATAVLFLALVLGTVALSFQLLPHPAVAPVAGPAGSFACSGR